MPIPQMMSLRDKIESVLEEIIDERERQNEKWGEQNHHPSHWMLILGEEVGECNKATLEANSELKVSDWTALRTELIQVAAVCVATIESMDRNQFK
jgi:NTP pyrophosphatase (non-canonical NTP hydrolase)